MKRNYQGDSMSLLALLLLTLELGVVLSCQCIPMRSHWQDQFCSHTYVVKGKAVSQGVITPGINGRIFYEIEVDKKFKGSLCHNFNLTTGANGALCGVLDLPLNEQYLLMFTYSGGRYRISSCSNPTSWVMVTKNVKTHLASNYRNHCNCKFNNPNLPPFQALDEALECDFSIDPQCLLDNSYCANEDGECELKNDALCNPII